ncbi:MAG: DUF3240 family protein [Pseudomonadota bacterium]
MNTATNYEAMLTLAIPGALEGDVLDFLLLHPEHAPGFSVVDAHGMGQGATLHTTLEQVQGRCRRKLVYVVGSVDGLQTLVQALAQELRNAEVAWWLTPVLGFGRLA